MPTARVVLLVTLLAAPVFAQSEAAQGKAAVSLDQEDSSLRERLEQLEAKIEDLESRLSALERPQPGREVPRVSHGGAPFSIALVEKQFQQANVLAGDTSDRLGLTFVLMNNLPKDVRAVAGIVVFKDLFGEEIVRMYLTDSRGVAAGRSTRWDGWIGYHEFTDAHRRLRTIEKGDLKVDFLLDKVVYTDESIEVFGDADELSGTALTAQQIFVTATPPPASAP